MLEQYHPTHVLFLDIETVPRQPSFEDLNETEQAFWEKRSARFRDEEESAADVYQRAGIYSEFGRIVCISVGLILNKSGSYGFRVKSFYGENEAALLSDFAGMLEKFAEKEKNWLCAHNGKEFDFPFIIRRMLINGVRVPGLLNIAGKKPWEVAFLDTMELWKFGDYRHYTSLDLLTYLFDIPTPKDDIDGSMVSKIYHEDQDLERIVRYCEKDTLAVAQLFLRFRGEGLIREEDVEHA
ncbi:MAG TPA: 3'-5' exonuclease [Bacteroidales bacterium]|nr:3'-5' exonuclease [Bacteroidales bacterium]